jgi:Fic family protein
LSRLSQILEKIDLLQSEIDKHGELDSDLQKRINYKFRLDWNYYSNAMEGNSLTRVETKQLMMDNVTIDGKSFKDISEMRGHDEQVQEIFRLGKGEARISERRIKEMHKAIMHEDDPELKNQIGEWKTTNNHLINFKKEKFEFLPHDEVPEAMHDLINRTNAEIDALSNTKKESKHPVLIASEFHLEYIRIHPFYDGNGRTARLLTNLLLISFGYPPFLLSEDSKKSYYRHLGEIQGYGGDPKDFHEFIGELIVNSQQLVLDAIAGKDISEDDDIDKEILLFKQSLAVEDTQIDHVKQNYLISQLYESSIKRLFTAFIEAHEVFTDLFHSLEIVSQIGNNRKETTFLEFFDTWVVFERLASEIDQRDDLDKLQRAAHYLELMENFNGEYEFDFDLFQLELHFKGFKKNGNNPFDISTILSVQFGKYGYGIDDGNEQINRKKLYTQDYSKTEIKEIVREKKQLFFQQLKEKTSV